MTSTGFPSPHVHPQSLDSGSTPEAFVERELELGTGTLTATDHGSMGACRKVYDLAKTKGLTPILGLEAYFRDDNCDILASRGIAGDDVKKYLKYEHLTMHCLDEQAFSVLSKKLSGAKLERHGSEAKPLFDWKDLEEVLAQNITVGSGCLVGLVQRHILAESFPLPERFKLAEEHYLRIKSMARPGNFYVEVFPHKCTHDWVSGVFLDLADGQRIRFWADKKLRLEKHGEITAIELAKLYEKKAWEGDRLVAVKNYRKWTEQEPVVIAKVEHVRNFLQNECLPWCPDGDMQLSCNRIVLELARVHGDPVLISDDAHFAHPEDKILQDVRLRNMGDWRFFGSYHRQSADEAYKVFSETLEIDRKTFDGWVDNNRAWGDRFKAFKFNSEPSLPTKFYPTDTLAHTAALIRKHGRMDFNRPEYMERLKTELELLHFNGKLDLLPYFFVGEDVCSFYEKLGLLTGPGRGSAAGLLLTYLLGITHVDPLRYDLSLERFITLDRIKSGKLPDIDQDLPFRDPLVDPEDPKKGWLPETFGDHYAQIGVNVKLKLKSSVKDVARALRGYVPPDIEEMSKKFVLPPQGIDDYDFVFGYEDNGTDVPGSLTFDKNLQRYVEAYPKDWAIAQNLMGIKRQSGRHACGFAIANKPIADFIPLEEVGGVMVTQFAPEQVEAAGGVKMDFLVVNSLNDISAAVKIIQQRHAQVSYAETHLEGRRVPSHRLVPLPSGGQVADIWDLPEDQAVYRDVCEGRTETVFQFNTSGAVQWLANFNHWKNEAEGRKAIDSLQAMAAFTALDRPGPLDAFVETPEGTQHNMLVEFARRARGEVPVDPVPALLELLPETYGILCFQEGLQKVYQKLTGCTGSEAEEFRGLVAKKKMEKVLKAKGPWMERVGAKLGVDTAAKIWEQIVTFGQYGFNKSHALCYSNIAYACAYLKHHFPLEWWCAVLRNATKEEIADKFWMYVRDLVDLPEIGRSEEQWEIQNERLRAPTSLLHGVGANAHKQLMGGRPYRDIDDYCLRMEEHCVKNAKPVLDEKGHQVVIKKMVGRGKAKQEVEVRKVKRATSALNRKVNYSLIIAGVLDSLFPAAMPDGDPLDYSDKLAMYEAAHARAQGKKKPQAVDANFWNMSPLKRFQMRKAVLPAYSEPLMTLIAAQDDRVAARRVDGQNVAFWPQGVGWIAFRPPEVIALLNEVDPIDQPIWVAVPAYIQAQRHFQYAGGSKEACEFMFDVDGQRLKFVKWPGWKDEEAGQLDRLFKSSLKGAVVVATLCRKIRKDGTARPFSLEDITVIQPPLVTKKKKENTHVKQHEPDPDDADGTEDGGENLAVPDFEEPERAEEPFEDGEAA